MATIQVSSFHLEQSSRIRKLLLRYRDLFLNYYYITGSEFQVSAYPYWIDLCLITSKVRPAFLIQWVDFLKKEDYMMILKLLTQYRDHISELDLDYRLYFITSSEGIIVTTYYTYFKHGLAHLHVDYLEGQDDLERNLKMGHILGYPSAGENNDSTQNKFTFDIYIKLYGLESEQIYGIIYTQPESRQKLYEYFQNVRNAIKIYDSSANLSIVDSQGNLTSSYIPETHTKLEATPEQWEEYKEFTQSEERIMENWNDEFDRVFVIGYNYRA